MAEAYQGNDYLSENENATAKTAADQKAKQASSDSEPASGGQKKGGLVGAIKSDVAKLKGQGPDPAPSSGAQSGGLVGAIKGSFKKGGTVPETGAYLLHKDEQVIPVPKPGRNSEYRRTFEERGKKGLHKYGK